MRIAFFNWRDINNPSAGGAEVFNHKVLANLVSDGHRATLFTSRYPGAPMRENIDGIEHVRYGGRFMIYPKSPLCYRSNIRGKYDVIVESVNGVPFFTKLFSDIPTVPFVHQLTRENWYSGISAPIAFMGYHLEDSLLKLYRDCPAIVPSESTKKDLLSLGFRNVRVVHGAADISAPKTGKEKSPTILYFGRLTRSKGVADAIRVFQGVQKRIPEAALWIAGRGPEEENLRKLAQELGLKNVKFWGYVDEKEKARLLSRAHLMLLPASREGWGLVVLEANRCGTPVIGYRVPGLVDSIRPGLNGYLADDANSMESIALDLLESKGKLADLSATSEEFSMRFDWKKTSREFGSFLEEVLIKNGRGKRR